ncbi:Uncharacterized protein OBRU01_20171, partial [Operophtera brumata]
VPPDGDGRRSALCRSRLMETDGAALCAELILIAISEGRGMARGEIGMAAIDLRHPHLVLCQFSDTLLYTHTLTKINFFNPIEIIVPHTFCEGVKPNQLYQLIKDQYPRINLTTVQRRHFNDATGRQNIQTLCAPLYSAVYLQVLHKFYALTAAAAVLKYVEYIQCIVFARETLKIEYHSSENTMIIGNFSYYARNNTAAVLATIFSDVGTATQLELVQPLVPSAGPSCCLLGVLGPMYTLGGIRALRASILQPSCNKEFIENRLDADAIKKLSDIDKILFLCVESTNQNIDKMGEAQLNQTILLKTTMDMVPKLIESLKAADSGRLKNIKLDFENPHYVEIADRIRKIIQDDAHLEKGAMGSLQRCFAVKPNLNGLLDVARRTYSELIEDIQKILEQLSETYDLQMSVVSSLLKELRPFMSSLYKLCEDVAELDILVALAQASTIGSYIRPEFGDYLDIRNSVHPLLDYNSQVMPVPNDVYASPEQNFTIITGPNMGGKSIYIKQVAVLQVMAQLGCFLPATNAVLRICDRIFSRIGFNDSVELNASTFVYEIKEMQHIMKGLTKSSLVIVDELCRSTSDEEGNSIAWAICEELLLSDAFTFFTTHFTYLTRLQDLYYNVVNRHTVVDEEDIENTQTPQKRLIYTHKIELGINTTKNYGLALAAKTHLPEDIVKLAYELAGFIARNETPQEVRSPEINDEKTLYDLNAEVRLASRRQGNSEEIVKQMLQKFKTDNPLLIERLNINKSNDITDCSANYTLSNSRQLKQNTNRVDNKNVPPSRLFNNSDDVSSNATVISSAIGPMEYNETVKNNDCLKHGPIKSSNELLNRIMFLDKDSSDERIGLHNESMNEIEDERRKVSFSNERDSSHFVENSMEMEIDELITTENQSSPNLTNINLLQSGISVENTETINISDDSDIADALTQVIEEFSVENGDTSSGSSLEEEFICDVVNEINYELMRGTIQDILTPPIGFQDECNNEEIVLTPPIGFRDECTM